MGFDIKAFGDNLRGIRNKRRMSQTELAKASGVSLAAITNYENGGYCPGADKIWDMCEALQCTPNDLFEREEER